MQIQKINVTEMLKNILIVIFGNFIYAVGVCFFILPSGLITGGTTGIALIGNHALGLPISPIVACINVLMFVLGFIFLGKAFALNTLVSTIAYPTLLGILSKTVGDFVLTDDLLLCALFGGLCIGISLSMILRIGASTGGMDIPPLLLQKFAGIPVSVSLYVFDFAILIGQMFFSGTKESLYGIILVIVYTITLDKFLSMGESRTQLQIISSNADELKSALIDNLDRGVTLFHAKTGYLEKEIDVIQCVITARELHKAEKLIRSISPDAFIVTSKVNSVKGRGFSLEKEYLNLNNKISE